MSDKSVYEIIKKQNGEAFAKAIRNFDNGIFEVDDLPKIVRHAGRNALPLLNYLESLKQINIQELDPFLIEDPFTLLKRAGYDAFYADSLEKQNSIMDYYADMEALCTFRDFRRFEEYHIIHCIKEGAGNLKRRDFEHPDRQDEYGTSVISIQILKTGGFISIKNRYNHSVDVPDNTFNSNPDNIIAGLSASLKQYFNVDFASQPVELEKDFIVVDGLIYAYHIEADNAYFGENYYIVNDEVHFINPDYQMIVDNFIIDFQQNKLVMPIGGRYLFEPEDALFYLFQKEMNGKKLTRRKEKDVVSVYADNELILKARKGGLIYCDLKQATSCDDSIFVHHPTIEEVRLENIEYIYTYSFKKCPKLRRVLASNCKTVGAHSFSSLPLLSDIDLQSVVEIENNCFKQLDSLKDASFFELQIIGGGSFRDLPVLKRMRTPNLIYLGSNSVVHNPKLSDIDFSKLNVLQGFNLSKCSSLRDVSLKNLEVMGDNCLSGNDLMQSVSLPCVQEVKSKSLSGNPLLKSASMPLVKIIHQSVLSNNPMLEKLTLKSLEKIGGGSISENNRLWFLSCPNLVEIQENAFFKNPSLRVVLFDALKELLHCNVFINSPSVEYMYAPNMQKGISVIRAMIGSNVAKNLKIKPSLEREN